MNGLPPLADAEDVEHVRRICAEGRANISGRKNRQTQRYMMEIWRAEAWVETSAVADVREFARSVQEAFGNGP